MKYAQRELQNSPKVLSYLNDRGVSAEQILSLGLGYVPEDKWPPYIDPKEATEEEVYYLNQTYKGSRLKGKLLFPMTNAVGMVKGFQIRTPNPDVKDYWKYYSPRSDIDGLYFGTAAAMDSIWRTREIYLVEGMFDLFPVQRMFPNTISAGTANLSVGQDIFLKRYATKINIMFDNDEQGERFFKKFYHENKNKFERIVQIKYAGKDPSESLKRLGVERFQNQFKMDMMFYG